MALLRVLEDRLRLEDSQGMEGNTVVIFDKQNDQEAERRLAQFLAELTRQGIRYTIRADAYSYEVTLTGGY